MSCHIIYTTDHVTISKYNLPLHDALPILFGNLPHRKRKCGVEFAFFPGFKIEMLRHRLIAICHHGDTVDARLNEERFVRGQGLGVVVDAHKGGGCARAYDEGCRTSL